MSIAEAFFMAQRAFATAERDVYGLLLALLGEKGYSDFTADYYDESIEVYGVHPQLRLTDEQQAGLWAAGFRRCWTHTGTERRDDKVGECAYAAPRPAASAVRGTR